MPGPLVAAVVETEELLNTVIASFAAGIGVTAAFSIMILGAARFSELRRDERLLAAAGFGFVMALAFAATAASIVFGIIVMTQK